MSKRFPFATDQAGFCLLTIASKTHSSHLAIVGPQAFYASHRLLLLKYSSRSFKRCNRGFELTRRSIHRETVDRLPVELLSETFD